MKKTATTFGVAFLCLLALSVCTPARHVLATTFTPVFSQWIQGSLIDSTTIGANTPSAGYFTSLNASTGITGNLTGSVSGNASTASALQTSPNDCGATVPTNGIAANGNANCMSSISIPSTANAATATALAATPTNCGAGVSSYGIAANGNALCNSSTHQVQGVAASGCTTPVSTSGQCTNTMTWTTPFADANYIVACSGHSPFTSGSTSDANQVILMGVSAQTATTVSVVTGSQGSGQGASFGTVSCVGVHP